MRCEATAIHLTLRRKGDYQPAWQTLQIALPAGEQRALFIDGVAADAASADVTLAQISRS